ncbi:MAG: hypothetical protein GY696_07710 [Gammaproteobacteria bacterium]|nr:hypothetical protein [Gammaproteobacteria bacterium]
MRRARHELWPLLTMSYDTLKQLSDIIKSAGVCSCDYGSLVVELPTMRGRGVDDVDWHCELEKRLHPELVQGMLAQFDSAALRQAVRRVIASEIPVPPHYDDPNTVFVNRFATTKGGSHSAACEVNAAQYCDDLPVVEKNRRNFMESVHTNFLLQVPPGAFISRSAKLEHGKTRALYACDTVNYFHFDAPCSAIERAWLNNRAVLQPAGSSDYGDFRLRAARARHYKIMMDFADFNSAHTLEAQKIVTEELFAGLQVAWRDWLVASFDNMQVRDCDGTWRRVRGTLMSGHRMTSIVNTILNAAYTRLVLGEELYLQIHSEHVGDDIVMSTDDADAATLIVDCLMGSALRFQRSKQSFGTLCCEL